MGIRRSWAEVDERDANNNNDIVNQVYKAMRTVGCELWSNVPDWVSQNKALTNSWIRSYMNDVCKNEPFPLPPAPTVPFTGGQCEGSAYTVTALFTWGAGNADSEVLGQIGGPITNVIAQVDDSPTGTCGIYFQADGQGSIAAAGSRPCPVTFDGWQVDLFIGSNNCGDPPVSYPGTLFDPNTFSDTIDVPSGDGTNLSFPVTLKPNINNFPLIFDVGGLTVKFDLGGIEIEFGDININNNFTNLPDDQPNPLPAPTDDSKRNTCTKLTPSPEDIPPPGSSNPYTETVKSPSDPKEETITNKVKYIRITITSIPANANVTSGMGSPNIIFPGWFMWKQDDYVFSRQFINFEQSTFIAPEGVNGYAYTLQPGYTGFATIYELDV